jgi:regulator of protease activity HflC (stomatin/prohibitin superfamily)
MKAEIDLVICLFDINHNPKMEVLMDALWIVLLIFLVAGAMSVLAAAALALTYQMWTPLLAKRKLFVVTPQEGTGMWILKNGKAWRFITPDAKKDPDPVHCDVTEKGIAKWPNPEGKLRTSNGGCEPWWIQWIDSILPGGMRWIGVPWIYTIYEYNLRWSVLRQNKPSDDEEGLINVYQVESGKYVASFAKRIDYVFLRNSVYYLRASNSETQGADNDSKDKSVGMAIGADLVPTVRVVNPYTAHFVVHDWLESSLNLVGPAIRTWIANHPYQEINRKSESAQRQFDEFLQTAPAKEGDQRILDYLETKYGVRFESIGIDNIVPPAEYATATTRRAEAVQDAVRIVTLAEAEARKTSILADGQAEAVKKLAEADAERIRIVNAAIAKAGGNAFGLEALATFKDIGENGNTIIMGGANPVNMMINASKNPEVPPSPSQPSQPPRNQGNNQQPNNSGGKP